MTPPSLTYICHGQEYSWCCGNVPSGILSTLSQCAPKYPKLISNQNIHVSRHILPTSDVIAPREGWYITPKPNIFKNDQTTLWWDKIFIWYINIWSKYSSRSSETSIFVPFYVSIQILYIYHYFQCIDWWYIIISMKVGSYTIYKTAMVIRPQIQISIFIILYKSIPVIRLYKIVSNNILS